MQTVTAWARWAWVWVAALSLVVGVMPPAMAQPKDYKLGYGDALTVTVVGQPTLSVDAQPIRPDGRISLPLVQDVTVEGKTVPEITAALNRSFRTYLANPQVLVTVAKFRPIRVTVLGQVVKPGTFNFEGSPSVVDALATAGGLTERAARDGIRVIPAHGPAVTYTMDQLLLSKKPMPQLNDGDVIEINEMWTPDLYRIIPIVASVVTATGVVLRLVIW